MTQARHSDVAGSEVTGNGVLGVGVAGYGWMGEVHGRAFGRLRQHFPEVARTPRLVAVADPEPTRRDRAIDVYGFEVALADWRQLLVLDDVERRQRVWAELRPP